MTTTSVCALTLYESGSPFHQSDQILVPAVVWEAADRRHQGAGPIFVEVGDPESGIVGRLRPAVPSDGLPANACSVPEWMWMRLGAPEVDSPVGLTPCDLPTAGAIMLRARRQATLTGSADPVAMLTDALTGVGGGLSWACLCAGSELPLPCGVFDVMDVRSLEGWSVPAACILDCELTVEFEVALDAAAGAPLPSVPEEEEDWSVAVPVAAAGFVPFSGAGRRLG